MKTKPQIPSATEIAEQLLEMPPLKLSLGPYGALVLAGLIQRAICDQPISESEKMVGRDLVDKIELFTRQFSPEYSNIIHQGWRGE